MADDFYLVNISIGDFRSSKLVCNHHHQFKTVEPVRSYIVSEVRFIRNTTDADTQMIRNERSDLADRRRLVT